MAKNKYDFDLSADEKIPEEIGLVKPLPMDNVQSDGYESTGTKVEKKDDDEIKMTNFRNSPTLEEYSGVRKDAEKDSVGNYKEVDYSSQRKNKIGCATAIILALGISVASICAMVGASEKIKAERAVLTTREDVIEGTYRVNNNQDHEYNTLRIAHEVIQTYVEDEHLDYDLMLYGVCKGIGSDELSYVNGVMSHMADILKTKEYDYRYYGSKNDRYVELKEYVKAHSDETLDDYLVRTGYVDKNGESSYSAFEKVMDKKVMDTYKEMKENGVKRISSSAEYKPPMEFNGDWENPVVTIEVPAGKTR